MGKVFVSCSILLLLVANSCNGAIYNEGSANERTSVEASPTPNTNVSTPVQVTPMPDPGNGPSNETGGSTDQSAGSIGQIETGNLTIVQEGLNFTSGPQEGPPGNHTSPEAANAQANKLTPRPNGSLRPKIFAICGGNRYDSDYFFCCNERLIFKRSFSNVVDSCCKDVPYNSFKNVCCMGKLSPQKGFFGGACCGAISYSRRRELCCGGKVIPSFRYDCNIGCCGGMTVYNNRQQRCCDGVLYQNNRLAQCCGKQTFNPLIYLCCYSGPCVRLRIFGRYTRCCGNGVYDFRRQFCCGDQVFSSSPYLQCCHDFRSGKNGKGHVYDIRVSSCCAGKVVRNPYGRNGHCCIEYSNQNGQFIPIKISVLNWSTERCCNGAVVKILSPRYSRCCGKKLIDVRKQICCNGCPIYCNPSFYSCCNHRPYDRRTELCCNGAIQPKKYRLSRCCDCAVYNPDTHVCCRPSNRVLKIEGTKRFCCNGILYDRKQSICCENRLFHGRYSSCCGPKPYLFPYRCCNFGLGLIFNPRFQGCCNGNVVTVKYPPYSSTFGFSCCNGKPYDARRYICCCNCLYSRSRFTSCCGTTPYNYRKQICCYASGRVFKRYVSTSYCCGGWTPFNYRTHRCCSYGTVVPRFSPCP